MTWSRNHVRSTEWVLEELYQTGRQWMSERARQRRYAPITSPISVPPEAVQELQIEPGFAADTELRRRFEKLVDEFVERIHAA